MNSVACPTVRTALLMQISFPITLTIRRHFLSTVQTSSSALNDER